MIAALLAAAVTTWSTHSNWCNTQTAEPSAGGGIVIEGSGVSDDDDCQSPRCQSLRVSPDPRGFPIPKSWGPGWSSVPVVVQGSGYSDDVCRLPICTTLTFKTNPPPVSLISLSPGASLCGPLVIRKPDGAIVLQLERGQCVKNPPAEDRP